MAKVWIFGSGRPGVCFLAMIFIDDEIQINVDAGDVMVTKNHLGSTASFGCFDSLQIAIEELEANKTLTPRDKESVARLRVKFEAANWDAEVASRST